MEAKRWYWLLLLIKIKFLNYNFFFCFWINKEYYHEIKKYYFYFLWFRKSFIK